MILRELHEYYQRLIADPEVDVPQEYWSTEKAAWELVLNVDGTLAYADPLTTGEGKEMRQFLQLQVPEHPTRAGSGLNPFFLCDNVAYLLGLDEKRGEEKRAASAAFHREVLEGSEDAGAKAVLHFFDQTDPASGLRDEVRDALAAGSGFAVFRLKGDHQRLHERSAVMKAWTAYRSRPSENAMVGQCSVTGERGVLARLFPQVTGIPGAQSAGASLVSFNQKSFDSYGKNQAFNAAVSEGVAFNAGAALKHLFADPKHRTRCGKTTVVFWADRPAPTEDSIVKAMLDMMPGPRFADQRAEDEKTIDDVGYALKRMQQGQSLSECDPDVRYFILGVTPNAARLAVQFYEESSFGQLEESYRAYLNDIAMDRVGTPPLFVLLRQTAVRGNSEDIPTSLVSGCMKAMLTGCRFPRALLGTLLTRMRADHGSVNPGDMGQRAALIKACLVRDRRLKDKGNEGEGRSLQMALDREKDERGYVLGRLFAVMERAQTAAIGDVNTTIKDRYMSSAASTPGRVFPALLKNHQNHIAKLRKAGSGLCIMLEKEMDEVMGHISGDPFPPSLDTQSQGEFFVGYYQERCYLWKSKEEREAESSSRMKTEA